MIGFNYKANAKRILDRVAELKEEKKQLEEKQRAEERLKGKGKGWFSRLFPRPMSKRNPE